MNRPSPLTWLTALAICGLAGCAHMQHQHFVRTEKGGETRYYRVTISGSTWFSLTAFRYGWYDTDTVNQLYGSLPGLKATSKDFEDDALSERKAEIKPAPDNRVPSPPGKATKVFDGNHNEVDTKNKSLVVFLHADADYLAEQLNTLAMDKDLANDVVALVNRKEIEDAAVAEVEAEQLELSLEDLSATGPLLAALLELYEKSGSDSLAQQNAQKTWGSLVDLLRGLKNAPTRDPSPPAAKSFSDLGPLKTWWQDNRDTVGEIQ